jgi:hypothetical protein
VKRPLTEPGVLAPQCGCDGITYWNGEIAAFHGINVAAAGACVPAKATACSDQTPCKDDASCNLDVGTQNKCSVIEPPLGTCWQLPKTCPDVGGGGRVKYCLSIGPACASYCDAIRSEQSFYRPANNCN